MPIQPFLAGEAFEPKIVREMCLALESVCKKLDLNLTDDPATRLVAQKIIQLAQRGVRDATTLSAMTLKEFKHQYSLATFATIPGRLIGVNSATAHRDFSKPQECEWYQQKTYEIKLS